MSNSKSFIALDSCNDTGDASLTAALRSARRIALTASSIASSVFLDSAMFIKNRIGLGSRDARGLHALHV